METEKLFFCQRKQHADEYSIHTISVSVHIITDFHTSLSAELRRVAVVPVLVGGQHPILCVVRFVVRVLLCIQSRWGSQQAGGQL